MAHSSNNPTRDDRQARPAGPTKIIESEMRRPDPDASSARCALVGPLEVLTSPGAKSGIVELRATFKDHLGKIVDQVIVASHRNPEDVVSVLAFNPKSGKFSIGRGPRPVLLARKLLDLPLYGDAETGRTLGAQGGYLGLGFKGTVDRIVEAKLGAPTIQSRIRLGSAIHPNVKDLSEVDYGALVIVKDESPAIRAPETNESRDPFGFQREVYNLSAQQIADRIFGSNCRKEDRITDPRLLVYLERSIAALRARGEALPPIYSPSDIQEFIADCKSFPSEHLCDSIRSARTRITDLERKIFNGPGPDKIESGRTYESVEISTIQKADSAQGLTHLEGTFENLLDGASANSKPQKFEAVLADCERVLLTTFTKIDNELYLVANVGARASLKLRDTETRMMQSTPQHTSVEGIFIEVAPKVIAGGVESIVSASRDTLCETLGVGPNDVSLKKTDCGLFFSPGFNTRGAQQVLAFVPADKLSAISQSADFALISLKDLHAAGDSGLVKDLALLFSASILTHSLPESQRYDVRTLKSTSDDAVNTALSAEPQFFTDIRKICPDLLDLARREPIIHHLLCKRANLGGISIVSDTASPKDTVFFNSNLEQYLVHRDAPPARIAQLLIHDLWHYEHPDSYGATFESMIDNEIDAVTISEVWFVAKYGLERFEIEDGRGSIAGLQRAAGIIRVENGEIFGLNEARDCIRQAIRFGKLDPGIISALRDNPKLREKYGGCVCEKLLGYYVRDTQKNVQILIDSWKGMPQVAALASEFKPIVIPQPENFEDRLNLIVSNRDVGATSAGYNVVKGKISDFLNAELYRPAMRLCYLTEKVTSDGGTIPADVDVEGLLTRATKAHRDLTHLLATITDIDFSSKNLAALAAIERLREDIGLDLLMGIELIAQRCLNDAEAKEFKGRSFLPFPTLQFNPQEDGEMRNAIQNLFRAQVS